MKKLAAILLIAIFTFNIVGYQLLSNYFLTKWDIALEKIIDKNQYNETELAVIKLPINLPYYTNNKTFERIDGEVEINGLKYKYVKYRIYNDSLEMLCIPNIQKMKIEVCKNDYAKLVHDFQQENSKKKSNSSGKSFKKGIDFLSHAPIAGTPNILIASDKYFCLNTHFCQTHFLNSVEQPPDFI